MFSNVRIVLLVQYTPWASSFALWYRGGVAKNSKILFFYVKPITFYTLINLQFGFWPIRALAGSYLYYNLPYECLKIFRWVANRFSNAVKNENLNYDISSKDISFKANLQILLSSHFSFWLYTMKLRQNISNSILRFRKLQSWIKNQQDSMLP